ncbi:hypothetical protein NUM3379_31040 [Kineococcus sp. NUM-3379]
MTAPAADPVALPGTTPAARWAPPGERSTARRAGRTLLSLLALAVAATLVALVPRAAGTSWAAVVGVVSRVPPTTGVALLGLWLAGLWCYTGVLTAAMPGLTRRRALLLNLSGSAVANVLPLGGAAGVALNAAMTTSWGHTRRETAAFTVVSNVVDVASKVLVAGTVLAVALVSWHASGAQPVRGARALLLTCGVVGLLGALLLVSDRVSVLLGRLLQAVTGAAAALRARLRGTARPPARPGVDLPAFRRDTVAALRGRWRQFGAGALGYLLLQALLLAGCLHAGGAPAGAALVLVAFAVDRLATMLPITPSGTGFAEAGSTAVLVAAGVPATSAVAGVLLYRAFVVLLEIPVGGLALAGWLLHRRAGKAAR